MKEVMKEDFVAKYKYNTDHIERERIIFDRKYDEKNYPGGISYFKLSYEKLRKLADFGHIDPNGKKGNSPTALYIIEFLEEMHSLGFPGWSASGYAVSKRRQDYRITIDGVDMIRSFPITEQERKMVSERFKDADDLYIGDFAVWVWYD